MDLNVANANPETGIPTEFTVDIRSKMVAARIAQDLEKIAKYRDYDEAACLTEEFLESETAAQAKAAGLEFSASFGLEFFSVQGVVLHMNKIMKVAQVAPILGWFAQRGSRQVDKASDYAEMQRRTWNLGKIQLMGFFSQEENACKYVKVGERMEPIYKLMCPDSMDTPETPVADETVGPVGSDDIPI